MAVDENVEEVRRFEDWYDKYAVDERDGCLDVRGLSPLAGFCVFCWGVGWVVGAAASIVMNCFRL